MLCLSASMIALPSAGVMAAEATMSNIVPTTPTPGMVTVSIEARFGDVASKVCQLYLSEELISETSVVIPKSLGGVTCGLTAAKWVGTDSRGGEVLHTRYYDLEDAMSADRSTKDILIQ